MSNVYIIEEGEYSDRFTIGVAFDEKIANAYAKLHNGYVEEVPLIEDANFIQRADNMIQEYYFNYTIFHDLIRLNYSGKRLIEPKDKNDEIIEDGHYCTIYVYTDNADKALKIARDKVMKYVAEKEEL